MTDDEFTSMVHREQWPLFRLCFGMLSYQRQDAEDAVQDTLLKAWRAADRAPDELLGQHKWLMVIAANTCRDHWKYARSRPVMIAEDIRIAAPHSAEDAALLNCELTEVFTVIDTALLPRDRGALIATALGYKGCELRMRNGTLKSRTHRSRERLRAAMALSA